MKIAAQVRFEIGGDLRIERIRPGRRCAFGSESPAHVVAQRKCF